MVAYTGIQGQNILITASDPSNPTEGQIWYNSTSNLLKGYQFATVNAWATGGNLNNGRNRLGGAGSQTAALAFGGAFPAPTETSSALSESYNGTSWTATPSLNTARQYIRGVGSVNTACIAMGGYTGANSAATESFNGSTWTTVNSMNTARLGMQSFGIQTAAITTGGFSYSPNQYRADAESWNGTSWTTVTSLPANRQNGGGFGTQAAGAVVSGQNDGGNVIPTSLWNGSSWTDSPAGLNTSRAGASAAGTSQTAGLAFGGYTTVYSGATETWNGSSWTTSPNSMATGRYLPGPAGSQTAALAFGGEGPDLAATEEWTGAALQTKTITTS
jgi:hypothetical protein